MLKSIFENEILRDMEDDLVKQANSQKVDNLDKAIDNLNSAITIFEEAGLTSQADKILDILLKIAKKGQPKKPKDPRNISDRHTKGLTSEKALENLKHHGTMFNFTDVSNAEDMLNLEVENVLVSELDRSDNDTFEEEP